MATKKVIEIEVKDNVNVTSDHFEDLNKEIKSVESEVNKLNDSISKGNSKASESFKPLKAQYREAQTLVAELSAKFGATSEQAIQAAKRAGELKDAIGDAKALTDAFNPDAKFNALSSSIGGVVSGFSAFQGGLGLLGVESAKVEETLLKVQSAMALSQGLQGLGEAKDSLLQLGAVIKNQLVTAFSTLRGAIISTGIGALVVAVGVFLPKILEWADYTGRAQRKQEDLNNSLERQQRKISESRKELEKDLDFRLRYAKALGKSDEELAKIKEGNTKKTNAAIYNEIEAARKRLKTLREVDLGVMASSKEEYQELVKNNRKKREGIVEEIKALKEEIKQNDQNILIDKLESNKKEVQQDRTLKTEKVKIKKEERAELDAIDTLPSKKIQQVIDNSTKELELRGKLNEMILEQTLSPIELEKLAVEEKYLSLQSQAQNNAEVLAEIEIAKTNDLAKINEKYRKEQAQKDLELQLNKVQIASSTFSALGALTEAFAGKTEEEQKKAFEVKKAFDIAQAVLDGYKSVMSAYAHGSSIGGPILGGIEAGVAGAFAIAQIRKIEQSTFTPSTPSVGGGGTGGQQQQERIQAPTFNVIGEANQTQQVSEKPVKAYVVSGEVTTQQSLDRNRLRNATL
jgi:hypothetical protein